MIGRFPQAVVWDDAATHHYGVYVDHVSDFVLVRCADCLSEFEIPMYRLESLKAIVLAEPDCQIIAWVERGHEESGI